MKKSFTVEKIKLPTQEDIEAEKQVQGIEAESVWNNCHKANFDFSFFPCGRNSIIWNHFSFLPKLSIFPFIISGTCDAFF